MRGGGLVVAHPFTEAGVLPVAPVVLAVMATCLALVIASLGPAASSGRRPDPRTWDGPVAAVDIALRSAGLAVLGVLLAASHLGPSAPTRNLAPMTGVVVGWPALVVASAALGPVWRRIDPFDGLARIARAPTGAVGSGSVWPAAAVALVLAGTTVVMATLAQPAAAGTGMAIYLVLSLAGCLALGRRTWLERVEPVGLVLTWTGYLRRGRLVAWAPPEGTAAVLGAVAGALLFGLLRRTDVWSPLVFRLGPRPADVVGVVLLGSICAAALIGVERLGARAGRRGTTTAAAVPVVAALTVVLWLAGGRLLVAGRVLPHVLVDPFGQGWTLLGVGGVTAVPSPLPPAGVVWLQVAVLLVGAVAGGRVARARDGARTAATGGAVGGALLLFAGVVLAVH